MSRSKKESPELRLIDAAGRLSDLAGAIVNIRPTRTTLKRQPTSEGFQFALAGILTEAMPVLDAIGATVGELIADAGLAADKGTA